MEKTRVARFKKLLPTKQAFVDAQIPRYEREALPVIGRGVIEGPEFQAPITDARNFNIVIIKQGPGKCVGLHDHPTVDVFMPAVRPVGSVRG